MNLEQEVYQFVNSIISDENSDMKQLAMAQEAMANLMDYYEEIQNAARDGLINTDFSVTVCVDGKKIKFPNIESVAEWMTNG